QARSGRLVWRAQGGVDRRAQCASCRRVARAVRRNSCRCGMEQEGRSEVTRPPSPSLTPPARSARLAVREPELGQPANPLPCEMSLAGGAERQLEVKPLGSLEVLDDLEEIAGLRVATWTEHAHQALSRPFC